MSDGHWALIRRSAKKSLKGVELSRHAVIVEQEQKKTKNKLQKQEEVKRIMKEYL